MTPTEKVIEFLKTEMPSEGFIIINVTRDGEFIKGDFDSNIRSKKIILEALKYALEHMEKYQ